MMERNPSVVELSAKKFVHSEIIFLFSTSFFTLHCICRPVREQRPVLSVVTEIRRFGMEVHMLSSVTTAHQNSQKSLAWISPLWILRKMSIIPAQILGKLEQIRNVIFSILIIKVSSTKKRMMKTRVSTRCSSNRMDPLSFQKEKITLSTTGLDNLLLFFIGSFIYNRNFALPWIARAFVKLEASSWFRAASRKLRTR